MVAYWETKLKGHVTPYYMPWDHHSSCDRFRPIPPMLRWLTCLPPGDFDAKAANETIAAMELAGGHYVTAAGILLARLASRLGPLDEVLDGLVKGIIETAPEW